MAVLGLEYNTFDPEVCSIFNVYNDIQFKMSKIFIDTRKEKDYNIQHIRSAINIPMMTSFDDAEFKLLEAKIDAFISRKIYTIKRIIWYGDTEYNENNAKHASFYKRLSELIIDKIKSKQKKKINLNLFNQSEQWHEPKVCILNCKYAAFEQKYPFLCDDKKISMETTTDSSTAKGELLMDFMSIYMARGMKIRKEFKVYPSQIIDDVYFLGNANHCRDEDILKNLKITHIINCTQTLNNEFERMPQSKIYRATSENSISSLSIHTDASFEEVDEKSDANEYFAEYIRVPVMDCPDQEINNFFISAIKFIEKTLSGNEKCVKNRILCHCHAGISRSTTITISYLMYANNVSLKDALSMVKGRREIINPNQGFRAQLIKFEKYLNETRVKVKRDKLVLSDLDGLHLRILKILSEIAQRMRNFCLMN